MFTAEELGARPIISPRHYLITTATTGMSNARSPEHRLGLCPHLQNGLRQPPHTLGR